MSAPLLTRAPKATASRSIRCKAVAAKVPNPTPDMDKRNTMNAILVAAGGLPSAWMAYGFVAFFVPPKEDTGTGGLAAKDAAGNVVKASSYLKSHPAGDVNLVQGLQGDPTYLIVKGDSSIESFGVNSICTHLGCVVPWVPSENKFKCPCHGSQYNAQGKVVRGPAPLSLALAHVDVAEDSVILTPWTETDFRTDLAPWWA